MSEVRLSKMAVSVLQLNKIFCTILGPRQKIALNLRFATTLNLAQTCKAGRQKFREVKPRPHKLRLAEEIRDLFSNNEMVTVLSYFDMKNVEWNELVYEVGKSNIKFRFLPNKIVHRALDSTAYVNICPLFISTTVVAYSKDIQIKGLLNALKGQRKVQLLGGKVSDRLFGLDRLTWVSKLPPLEQLHHEISMTLSQPAQNIRQLLIRNQQVLSQNLEMLASK